MKTSRCKQVKKPAAEPCSLQVCFKSLHEYPTGAFARFSDPQSFLDSEWRVVQGMAQTLKEASYLHLASLLAQRPPQGPSLLVTGARYFFRRAVEDDPKLAQGLAFSQMERLSKSQEEGFASLTAAMTQQGQRLEELLDDVCAVVVETHQRRPRPARPDQRTERAYPANRRGRAEASGAASSRGPRDSAQR